MSQQADLGIAYNAYTCLEPTERLDMARPESQKDEAYDLTNARHYGSENANTHLINTNRLEAAVNKGFVTGSIWGFKADEQSWLMDEGVSNSRQPLKFPLMQPMYTRLMGQGERLSINSRAEAVSQRARSRREAYIIKARMLSKAAKAGPDMARVYEQMGVTPDEKQSVKFAEDNYQDPLVKAWNTASASLSTIQNLEAKKKHINQNLTLSGLTAMHAFVRGSNVFWEVVDHEDLIRDPDAIRPDLTDSRFVGISMIRPISSLCETYSVKREQLKLIEEMSKQWSKNDAHNYNKLWPSGSPRVVTMYYKDGMYDERAFVNGPNGPELVSANATNDDGTRKYQESDFVDPPKNKWYSSWNGQKTKRTFVEVLRYCVFIPREYMPSPQNGENKPGDLVLESGRYKLQEFDPDHLESVSFPIKMASWMNIYGRIISPLTAAQSSQRIINQITTDIVWRMSKAPVPTVVIDKRAVALGGNTVKQAGVKVKNGDVLPVDSSHIGGVPQAVHITQTGIDDNIFKQFEIIKALVQVAEDAVGLYKDNYGAPGSANQLVGVKQLQLQQASIMMQPYIAAIQSLWQQVHQFNAQASRQFYIRHPWVLEDMVGDENFTTLFASKDFELEQFRVTTVPSIDPAEIKRINQELVLDKMIPLQMIGGVAAAEALDMYPEEMFRKVLEYQKELQAMQQAKAEADAKAAQVGMLREQETNLMTQEADLYNKAMDLATQADATNMKGSLPERSALAENLKPVAATA